MELKQILEQLDDNGKESFLKKLSEKSQSEEALTELVNYYIEQTRTRFLTDSSMWNIVDNIKKLEEIQHIQQHAKSGSKKKTSNSKAMYNSAFTRLVEIAKKCDVSSKNYGDQLEELDKIISFAKSRHSSRHSKSRVSPSTMYDICQAALSKFEYSPITNNPNIENDRGVVKVRTRYGDKVSPLDILKNILESGVNAALELKNTEKVRYITEHIVSYARSSAYRFNEQAQFNLSDDVEIRCAAYLGSESLKDWGDGNWLINVKLRALALTLIKRHEDDFKKDYFIKAMHETAGINTGETCYIIGKCFEEKEEFENAEAWYTKAIACHLRYGNVDEAFKVAEDAASEEFIEKKVKKATSSDKSELERRVGTYNSLLHETHEFNADEQGIADMQQYHEKLRQALKCVQTKREDIEGIIRFIRSNIVTPNYMELANRSLRMLINNPLSNDDAYRRGYEIAQRLEKESGANELTQCAIAIYHRLH
ncbi:hypothetical protein HY636_04960 [Candidatus Woesearchaeota archaeon]|nr:hypothetical protein [Candidatus Woesearchaeota archaeon]